MAFIKACLMCNKVIAIPLISAALILKKRLKLYITKVTACIIALTGMGTFSSTLVTIL